jgi:hypothetical protein
MTLILTADLVGPWIMERNWGFVLHHTAAAVQSPMREIQASDTIEDNTIAPLSPLRMWLKSTPNRIARMTMNGESTA